MVRLTENPLEKTELGTPGRTEARVPRGGQRLGSPGRTEAGVPREDRGWGHPQEDRGWGPPRGGQRLGSPLGGQRLGDPWEDRGWGPRWEDRGWGPPGRTEAGGPWCPQAPEHWTWTRPLTLLPWLVFQTSATSLSMNAGQAPGHAAPAVRTPRRGTQPRSGKGCLGAGPLLLLCPLGARTAPHSDERTAREQEDSL